MTIFTLKYSPKNSEQIFGQDLPLSQLKNFILNYKSQKHKAALLEGPIGVGKTSSVYALAKELNYDLLELNSSDLRDEASMKSFLSSALGQQSLFFRPKLILIDEVDNISGREDRGCIPALISEIESSKFPVILTANDTSDSKLKPLHKVCLEIEYHKPQYRTIANILQLVCEQEKISFDEKCLNTLARQVDGDIRAALIDLQICSPCNQLNYDLITKISDRKRTQSILNSLSIIFKSSQASNALPVLDDIDMDMNEIFLWMDENLPQEYLSAKSLAKAYESLARADVFNGRIKRRQHWRFLVYINNLLTAGISAAKDEKNPNFIQYKPTMRILKIWQANLKNSKKKEIAKKLALATHTSKKVALEQIPYFQSIFQKSNNLLLTKELNLTDEEVEWLRKKT
ncbi:replication factor C large subunit [Candidatus Woesearchaeota archaeon]|nr:replication factor C large subunit [Candidatus Woesearchaeota archaeon]